MSDRFSKHELREVTPELLSALESHAAGWIANALSTEPVAPERLVPAVHALYAAAGLKQPRVAIVSSPLAMAFAAGFAAAIWWARKNPEFAVGDGLAWRTCYFPRLTPHLWTRQASRSSLADDICRATELATQPYSEQTGLTLPFSGKNRTSAGFREFAAKMVVSSAIAKSVEHATRGACDSAANEIRETPALKVVRNTRVRLMTLNTRALIFASANTLYRGTEAAIRLAGRHERKNVEEAMRLFGEKGSMSDTPWGFFFPARREFYPGVRINEILERQREPTRVALEAASHPADLLADVAMLAYDLGADNGVDHLMLLHCARRFDGGLQHGNMDWVDESHLSALRDVLGLVLPKHEQFRAWETCAIEGGTRYVHDEFCIVSDRPEVLKVDGQGRPHCADGPSHRWRDGWSLYHWHGVHIPPGRESIILSPEQISVAAIEEEENAELRRVMVERYGAARYVTDSGATVVEELPPDHQVIGLRSARLLRKDLKGDRDESILFVDLLNSTPEPDGTVKRYLLRVDPSAYGGDASRHVHAAVASTWRNADGSLTFTSWRDYNPDAES